MLCDVKSRNSPIMALGDEYFSQNLQGWIQDMSDLHQLN